MAGSFQARIFSIAVVDDHVLFAARPRPQQLLPAACSPARRLGRVPSDAGVLVLTSVATQMFEESSVSALNQSSTNLVSAISSATALWRVHRSFPAICIKINLNYWCSSVGARNRRGAY
jgi:hypothetical protein